MRYWRALALVLALPLALAAGLGPSPARAIVGGEPVAATDGARRWTVQLGSDRGQLCTGVVIGPQAVLTAAHCVLGGGRFTVSAVSETGRTERIPVRRIATHASFLPGLTPSTQPGVDLAVAHLVRPMSSVMQALSPGGGIGQGEALTIHGFGLGAEGDKGSARALRRATLVSAGSYTAANSVVVAVDSRTRGVTPGAGACRGDSGGPIMRAGTTELVGLVSWSSSPANAPRRRVCGGFTAVTPLAEHAGWIASTARVLAEMPDEARSSFTTSRAPGERRVTRRSAAP